MSGGAAPKAQNPVGILHHPRSIFGKMKHGAAVERLTIRRARTPRFPGSRAAAGRCTHITPPVSRRFAPVNVARAALRSDRDRDKNATGSDKEDRP